MDPALSLYEAAVIPDWIDYNGHMSEAYYVLTFGFATKAFLDHLDIGEGYRTRTANSFYTVEAHINYLREAGTWARLRFATQLLDVDSRRIHLFHTMSNKGTGEVLATTALLVIHVDEHPRATPMPEDALDRLRSVHVAHGSLPKPAQAGRRIGLQD